MARIPRAPNRVKGAFIKISTTSAVVEVLDGLVATGLFGKTRADLAETLMRERLRDVVEEQGWDKEAQRP